MKTVEATPRSPVPAEQPRPLDPERFSTLRRLASDPRKRFVISMGGGGVPSLSGNTALVELIEELGLRQHVAEVWGTSAGAIVAGSWCSGTKAPRMREILDGLCAKGVTDVDWPRLVKSLLMRPWGAVLPDALMRGRRCYRAMVSGLAVETFEKCEIPFRCIAITDDPRGSRKIFREGPLAPAISASMSLPGVFLPYGEDGRPGHGYLDGGLIEKTPLYSPVADHTRLGDGRELLILGTYFGVQTNHNAVAHGFIDRFLVTIDTLADHLWQHQERAARTQPGVTVLLLDAHLSHDGPAHFDFSLLDRHRRESRAAYEDQLQNAKIALTLGTFSAPRLPCPA